MKLATVLTGASAALLVASAAHAGRGSDGALKLIYWQAPSMLNPYLAGGLKELEAASITLEPLARFNAQGELVPYLAAAIPTLDNGGIGKDLMSVTWTLKPGLKWSDGSPVTADDVVFTGQYCMDPSGGCGQLQHFQNVEKIEALGPETVKITFKTPMPNPYAPFTSDASPILQKKQFADCLGAKAPTCTEANFAPIGCVFRNTRPPVPTHSATCDVLP